LTRLIARENFIILSLRESNKSHFKWEDVCMRWTEVNWEAVVAYFSVLSHNFYDGS
jgi:hypothetical protein